MSNLQQLMNDEELKKAFSGMNQSMMGDIIASVAGDKQQALIIARTMGEQHQEDLQKQKERKIQELQGNFTSIPKDMIVKVLIDSDWDVDKAILPLYEFVQKQGEEEKKKQDLEKKRRERDDAMKFLKNMFGTIVTQDKIQEILDDNEGDVDSTTQELIAIMNKQEEEQKKKREEQLMADQERRAKIEVLQSKFPDYVTENEIVKILTEKNWDVKLAGAELLKRTESRKVDHLRRLFKTLTSEQIKQALNDSEWNTVKAMKLLTQLSSQKKEEEANKILAQQKQIEQQQLLQQQKIQEEQRILQLQQQKTQTSVTSSQVSDKGANARQKLQQLSQSQTPANPGQVSQSQVSANTESAKVSPETVKVGQSQISPKNTTTVTQVAPNNTEPAKEEKQVPVPAPEVKLPVVEPVVDKDPIREPQPDSIEEPLLPEEPPSPEQVKRDEEEMMKKSVQLGNELERMVENMTKKDHEELLKDQINLVLRGPPDQPAVPNRQRELVENNNKEQMAPPVLEQSMAKELPREDHPDVNKSLPVERHRILPVTVTTNKERYETADEIKVEWVNNEPCTASDWIAIYKKGDALINIKSYLTFQWVGKAGELKGALNFTSPNEFGEYEFCYFKQKSYQVSGCSKPVVVGPLILLTANLVDQTKIAVTFEQKTGRIHANSWIAVYPKGEVDNKNYKCYDWVSKSVDRTLLFDVGKAGDYEVRFFPSRGSYIDVARQPVKIDGSNSAKLTLKGEVVEVDCDIATADPSVDYVWVGLYFTNQTDNTQWRRYKYLTEKKGIVTFKAPKTAGVYEARVFANKSYDALCISKEKIQLGI